MRRAEVVWWRILGVMLILLGLLLFAVPRIDYNKSEQIPHTRYSVTTPKTLVVPRVAAVLVLALGVATMVFAGKQSNRP